MKALSAKRRWLLALLIPLFLLALLLVASDPLYRRAVAQAPAFPFPACQKVWGHRGYAADGGENSLRSVAAAFERGATGVEIDILYDRERDDFVVSHDEPYTLHDGQPLMLDTLLAAHGASGFFWLDAKDLRKLSPLTARKATARLAALIRQHGLGERAVVESRNALYLSWLADQGVYTSYLVSPNDQKYSALVYRLNAAVMKLGYALGGLGAISMNDYRYTPVTAATFGPEVAVLLSTVNDKAALQRWSAIPNVKVILSDDDHYALSACKAKDAP